MSPITRRHLELPALTGYRVWGLDDVGGVLHSVDSGLVWPGPIMESNPPPRRRNRAGLRAFAEPAALLRLCHIQPTRSDVTLGTDIALGRVLLSGCVIEEVSASERVYRAELAVIQKLCLAGARHGLVRALAERYFCPVVSWPLSGIDWEAMIVDLIS